MGHTLAPKLDKLRSEHTGYYTWDEFRIGELPSESDESVQPSGVNEDIEANIQKTVSIESEIVRCCEVEKTYLMKESELMKMVFAGEFELNGLTEVGAIMKTSLGQMEKELTLVRLDRENTPWILMPNKAPYLDPPPANGPKSRKG
ncbi:hypothetical protein Taro_054698 [Colocasia esculenta]|uniref:Uncharacterized protein n=1 Tax=Colocasia esculenta TaxID=4460 RepID=A0A843XPE2_COLES|nr:hypothetical protein [Colocasia esculenta]